MIKIFVRITYVMLYLFYFISVAFKSDFWGNILSPIVTLIAAMYTFQGFYLNEKKKFTKTSGIFLSLSIFNWAICDIIWGIDDLILKINPHNTVFITYGYSITNLLITISLFIFGFYEIKKWNRIQIALDTVTVSICIMMVLWVILFNEDMRNVILLNSDTISFISIASDVLIFVWTSVIFFSIRKGKMPLQLLCALIGMVFFANIDIVYYYQNFYNKYVPNSLLDGIYVFAFLIISIGAIIQTRSNDNLEATNIHANAAKKRGILLVAAPVLIILFKGFYVQYLLSIVLIIMVYFIFSDYVQKNIYKEEMYLKEKELNEKLEHMVKHRTKELMRKNMELDYLLNKDMITGLHNRRYFLMWLKNELPKLDINENVLLLYMNLNRYKMIKTMFGNSIGDKVLEGLSKRLKEYRDAYDDVVLVHYGEDAFIICKKGCYGYETGINIAEDIINICSDIYKIQEYEIRVTVNIGISVFPLDAKGQDDLIKHADTAMLQSTMHGINKAMAYDVKLGDLIYRKNEIEILLRKVNYDDEFMLFYQPQVNINDGRLVGFEALIRWKTSNGEYIRPDEFIPIAEQTGLIVQIGDWVMRKALKQVALWNKSSNLKIRMGINVSVKQLNGRRFINNLKEEIKLLDIQPEWIDIELTESIELEENPEIREILKEFRDMGISISIDDFGTGYSSLYYLKNLPINRIKIAKELIDNTCNNKFNHEIVKSVISIAKVKEIKVIAEGVENKEQWDCLASLKCDEIQGYYVEKPMPPETICSEWLEKYF